jgi:hypothetical protein
MNERERDHSAERPSDLSSGSEPTTNAAALESAQHSAKAYLAAAQSAINQALSGNSQAFNNALRQRGGQ